MGSRRKRQPPVVFEKPAPVTVTLTPAQIGHALTALLPRLGDVEDFKRLTFADTIITRAHDDECEFIVTTHGESDRVNSEAIREELRALLEQPLTTILCEMHDAIITLSPRGRGGIDIAMRDSAISEISEDVSLLDRSYIIRAGEADDLLKAIGLMNRHGEIRAAMRHKFRQINHFIELAAPSLKAAAAKSDRIVVLDCGCGKSYLSFALNYYLRSILKAKCHVYGIDTNEEVIGKSRAVCDKLGYRNMEFACSTIEDFAPEQPPDVVMSLHACDLATDQAIAKAINLGTGWILAVPCCQHELVNQIENETLSPITRHRLFKAALADTVTDAVRTLLMEAAGYHVDVIEFVAPDITPKNIMLRAEKTSRANPRALEEYRILKDLLHIDPQLMGMIGNITFPATD